jgi:hypothetical protein
MLNNFKWYRKLKGGNWFYNRYIFDLGRGVIFVYERNLPKYGWSYNIKQYNENYATKESN